MNSARQTSSEKVNLDPLYVIFEQHLFNLQDSDPDRKKFIENVIQDYLTFLRRLKIAIPKPLEQPILEELGVMVNSMLIKKIYGCLNIQEYQRQVTRVQKSSARRRYKKLEKKTSAALDGKSAKKA